MAETAARLGRFDEAIAAGQEAVALFPGWTLNLAYVYALAGRTEDAQRIVDQYEAQPPTPRNAQGLALVHAALGNRDEALHWLAFEPRHGTTAWFAGFPEFETYREDPRFQEILRRWNLKIELGDLAPTPLPIVTTSEPGG